MSASKVSLTDGAEKGGSAQFDPVRNKDRPFQHHSSPHSHLNGSFFKRNLSMHGNALCLA